MRIPYNNLKNILCLTLVISPILGFLFIDLDSILSIAFLFSLSIGVILASNCFILLRLKTWVSVFALLSCYGFFLMRFWNETPLCYVGLVLDGIGSGGLMVVLPSVIWVFGIYQIKSLCLGVTLTLSGVVGLVWKVLLERNTYLFLIIAFCVMLISIFLLASQPPSINKIVSEKRLPGAASFSSDDTLEYMLKKKGRLVIRLVIVCFFLSFSAGISLAFLPAFASDFSLGYPFFFSGLILGPLLCGYISNSKGIYSGSVLLIFLGELSVCFLFSDENSIMKILSMVSTGLEIGTISVIIPMISSFLLGNNYFYKAFPYLFFSGILGVGASRIVCLLSASGKISLNSFRIPLLLLVVLCFFLIFSAWKKRLFLLKSQ